jgi:hypothetical protein
MFSGVKPTCDASLSTVAIQALLAQAMTVFAASTRLVVVPQGLTPQKLRGTKRSALRQVP